MAEAPWERPENYTLLHSFTGHIKARPRDVFDAIARRFDPGPGSESRFTADARAYLVITQGGWWYRGEYRVVPDDHGSHVEHVILNVAQKGHRVGTWTGRKVIAAAPAEFDKLMRQLRLELE
ncbi:MAG: hypothetical protein WED09_09370 [Homoserinimonas sp.]